MSKADEKKLINQIDHCLETGQVERSMEIFYDLANKMQLSNLIITLDRAYNIYKLEKQSEDITFFDGLTSVDELAEKFTRLKFLLRRYDFEFQNGSELSEFIKSNNISCAAVIYAVNLSVVNKADVLNKAAAELFSNNMAVYALNILFYTLKLSPDDAVALYSISYILYCLGNYSEAMSFADKISEEIEEAETLKAKIREGLLNNGK